MRGPTVVGFAILWLNARLMNGPVLITGGSGFVGHHVVAECLRRGMPVRVLVRPTSRRDGLKGAQIVVGDLANGKGLRRAVAGADCVLHLAGLVKALDPDEFFEVNAGGTARLLRACVRAERPPRRVVLVSSLAAAGPGRFGRPLVEDDPPRPVSWYGRSKLEGERLALASSGPVEVTVVRPPAVYGPRDSENATFLDTLRGGFGIRFRGALERLSLIEVGDLVEAILLAAEAPGAAGRTYFVCHPEILGLEDMLRAMADALGVTPRFLTLPGGVVRLAGALSHAYGRIVGRPQMLSLWKVPELLARDWSCSPARAARELGFKARTGVSEGIPRFVKWYLDEMSDA
jgi:nucleoside-diphosphate-sugar epimerase